MKKNPVKESLKNNTQSYGCWVTVPHLLVPEILAPAGFDWLTVDMEHSSIDLHDLLPLIVSIEANGMVPLVRVGENDPNLIKRIMDAGAYGVIVANVCTGEEAERAVNAVKYPPHGTRGVGLYRAQKFGKGFEEYKDWLMNESLVIAQIEHIRAVRNIEEIVKVPGIDAIFIGPYDLSGSLDKPGDFEDPEVKAAIAGVLEAAEKHGMPVGYHAVSSDPAEARQKRDEGFVFLAFSLDSIILGDAAQKAMKELIS